MNNPTPAEITRRIIRHVADAHQVTVADVMGRRRLGRIVAARHDAIVAILVAKPHLSLPVVGQIFGLDHTTILHHAARAGLPARPPKPPYKGAQDEETAGRVHEPSIGGIAQ